jgi:hypothetical protein
MAYLDQASLACFAADEATRLLLVALEDRKSWALFRRRNEPLPPCRTCKTAGLGESCELEDYNIGCSTCLSCLDRCPTADEYAVAFLVERLKMTEASAKEQLQQLWLVHEHFKSTRQEYRDTHWQGEYLEPDPKLGPGPLTGSLCVLGMLSIVERVRGGDEEAKAALDDFRVLHLRMELGEFLHFL